ncbi:MAG: PHP-associated domain-containing protein, partial [Candidatus Woesearchaeota archaeon]
PFYPSPKSLGNVLLEHSSLFDAVEYHSFYPSWFPYFNRKAVRVASAQQLPVVANSDAHHLSEIGNHYTVIGIRELSVQGIAEALSSRRVYVYTTPKPTLELLKIASRHWL